MEINTHKLQKRDILTKIIGAGINITPDALDTLVNSKFSDDDLSKFIQEISFLKEFRSHITIDLIKKTKFKNLINRNQPEILDHLPEIDLITKQESKFDHKEPTIDNFFSNNKKEDNLEEFKSDNIFTDKNSINKSVEKQNPKASLEDLELSNNGSDLEILEAEKIADEIIKENHTLLEDKNMKKISKIQQEENFKTKVKSERANISYFLDKDDNINTNKIKTTSEDTISTKSKFFNTIQSSTIERNESYNKKINNKSEINKLGTSETSLTSTNKNTKLQDTKNIQSTQIYPKYKRFSEISSTFKPIAKEYDFQINIISDCNKYLYTSGGIEDFVELMKDKYNNLKKIILRNYQDAHNAIPIKQVNLYLDSREVCIIGMILEKKMISEDKYILTVEDTTGVINVLIKKNENNLDLFKNLIFLLEDYVVLIKGYLKVDNKARSRIIFANEIFFPDIFVTKRDTIPESPISLLLISDVHIGSKNFIEPLFQKLIKLLRGELGAERQIKTFGSIKYLLIAGDLVDGIGIYPEQENELSISDIYKQYEKAAELLSNIPDYIKIIYIPGNHEPVRNALPHPVVPEKYTKPLNDLDVLMTGDPSFISIHGIKTLLFHGDSFINMITSIPNLSFEDSPSIMKELLRARHLCPTFGKRTELAPIIKDWLVIEDEPHLFHTGHIHITNAGYYKGILTVNSGCFQSQTLYMKNFGITPTPGCPVIVTPKNGKLNATKFDLND